MIDTHDEPVRAAGIKRRQLLKAGAWAAPVLVLATAAPAAAASAVYKLILDGPTAYFAYGDGGVRTGVTCVTSIRVDFFTPTATVEQVNLVVVLSAPGIGAVMAQSPPSILEGAQWDPSDVTSATPDSVSCILAWGGTLQTDATLNGTTGTVRFTLKALEGVDLTDLGNIEWTMTANAKDSQSATASGPFVVLDEDAG